MGLSTEVEIGIGGLVARSVAQRAVKSINMCVQEELVALAFGSPW
jgi:hypothetical protein